MHKTRFFPISRAPFQALLGAAFALYACSFQDFDYLENGPAAEGGGGSGGGQSQSGGQTDTGGSAGKTSMGGASSGGKSSGGSGAGASGAPAGGDGGDGNGQGGAGGAVMGGAGGQGAGPGQGGAGGDAVAGAGGVPIGPEPMGNLLANPSFEQGLTGWTVDPATAVSPSRYVYTQAPTSGGTTVDGTQELATWHMLDEYTLSVSQVVKNLRPGTYTFKGNFSTQRTQASYVFARNCGGAEQKVTIPVAGFVWFEVAIPEIQVTTTTCEVGFSVHNVGDDWVNADMFTFEKVP